MAKKTTTRKRAAKPGRHELTDEERAKGGQNKAANERAKREELERVAREKLENALSRAADVLVEGLEADGVVVVGSGEDAQPHYFPLHAVRIRSADKVFDRLLGRPRQEHEHSGRLDLGIDIDLARSKLDDLITKRGAD